MLVDSGGAERSNDDVELSTELASSSGSAGSGVDFGAAIINVIGCVAFERGPLGVACTGSRGGIRAAPDAPGGCRDAE